MTEAALPLTRSFPPTRPRASLLTTWLYCRAVIHEFRITLLLLIVVLVVGTLLYAITPMSQTTAEKPTLGLAAYASWMAMLAQPVFNPPATWYIALLNAVYPLLGFLLIGEGVVRLALLVVSKRHGEKEWMRVMASTYRDHVVLCGLGRLGYRVLQQLTERGVSVVAIEKSESAKFLAPARILGAPILVRDMKEDQALLDAGIKHAFAVCLCTNDDMANLEVALDARRMNPGIRIVLRLFDQEIAQKIQDVMSIDAAFSASALAAPMVIAMTLGTRVLSTVMIGTQPFVTAEVPVSSGSPLSGKRVDEIERGYSTRVLAIERAGKALHASPSPADTVSAGETLVVHVADSQLASIASAGRAG